MGNTCAGPKTGRNGFFQSMTAAVWKPKQGLPAPDQDPGSSKSKENSVKSDGKDSSTRSDHVQSTPPTPMKMPEEAKKPDPPPPAAVKTETANPPATATAPAPATATANNNNNANNNKPAEGAPQNKPNHIKRVSSAGLQVESVLQRKTDNMKEKFTLGRKLGQGQFGTTFLCIEKGTNKEFACKTIAKRKLTTPEDVEDVRREIQIMHHLAGHPNVISIVGAYEDAVAVHVIMELCAGGELFDRIIQRGHYTERKAAELARIIVGVVQACHSLGVMHRDLKPENFLFVDQNEESPLQTIDFGLSAFFKPGAHLSTYGFGILMVQF